MSVDKELVEQIRAGAPTFLWKKVQWLPEPFSKSAHLMYMMADDPEPGVRAFVGDCLTKDVKVNGQVLPVYEWDFDRPEPAEVPPIEHAFTWPETITQRAGPRRLAASMMVFASMQPELGVEITEMGWMRTRMLVRRLPYYDQAPHGWLLPLETYAAWLKMTTQEYREVTG